MTDYKLSQLSQMTAPKTSTHVPLLDPSDTTTPPADASGSNKWATIGQLLGAANYIFPSGDGTGTTDRSAINAAFAAGDPVTLVPGATAYVIDQPLTPSTGSRLTGSQWWAACNSDNYGVGVGAAGGALIQAATAFSGAAMILMQNDSTTVQQYGADISGVTLYNPYAALTMHGISVIGGWGACFLRGVCVIKAGTDNLRFDVSTASGKVPDDWSISQCKFSAARTGHGVNVVNNLPDSFISDCESSENALDGWHVQWCDNTRFTGSKGENNGNGGWHFTGQGTDHIASLANCTSQLNKFDGFLFDESGGGSSTGTYILTGCRSRGDNQAASTYAGFRAAGSRSRIMASGCYASDAAYGAWAGGTSYGTCFTGSYLSGTTAATFDDGTNTHALTNQSPVPF